MKHNFYKLLLLGFIAAFMSVGSINLLANQPATPIKLNTKVEVINIPNKSDITLNWVDGDLKNELGNIFLITQYQKIDGKEKEEKVTHVKRETQKEKREYSYKMHGVQNGSYCYSVTLIDEKNNVSSDASERACVKLEVNDPGKTMHFSLDKELVKLNADGEGKFFVGVKNSTKCEFEVVVLESGLIAEVVETSKEGALLSLAAKEKGQYTVLLGLKDKCKDEIVEKAVFRVCYGDCENPHETMFFAGDKQSIILNDEGMAVSQVKIINNTKCEYEIVVLQSMVKIAIENKGANSALIKFTADIKGKYISSIGLINKCTGELVSKMTFDICWGDCNPNEPRIYFEKETQFSHKLEAGVAWKYDVNAVSKDDCKLTYLMAFDKDGNHIAPEGLVIDEETGMMSWEKPVKGEYNVAITVKSTCDGGITYTTIFGKFNLFVRGAEPTFTSTLTCNFYDETDDIKDFVGKVTVWSADERDPGVPPTKDRRVFTAELKGTSVTIKLPTGKYYLKADVKGYKGQYYEDAFNFVDAKTIEVGENEDVEVGMMLHSIPEPHYYVVTGQVTDAATGEPLPAVVTFVSVKSVLGGAKSDNDHGNGDVGFDSKVKTDENGNYSIKLPDTFTYYANANSITNNHKYKLQWFEGADSYYEANIIYLDSDKGDVNFKLESAEATQGYMSGTVTDKEGNVVQSTVIALHKGDKSDYKVVTKTDEKGNFSFGNMKYGDYVVLSLPVENSYIPGYYVEDDYTTLKWKNATFVSVGDFAPTPEVNILHAKSDKDRAKGIARIKGHLRRKAKGIAPGGNAGSSDEEAISGGLVYLTNDAAAVVSYFVSDVDGSFELEGIEPGTYILGIDKFGFDAYADEVVIDYSENIEIETEITLSQVATSVDYLDFSTAKLSVSPMPVTNLSRVSFDGKAGLSNIKLVDMTGNVVYQTSLNTVNGNNNFDLDAKNITAGTYILVIENEEKSVAGSITIIK